MRVFSSHETAARWFQSFGIEKIRPANRSVFELIATEPSDIKESS
jgi:hypothetical protein